jgi:hypothetical protein
LVDFPPRAELQPSGGSSLSKPRTQHRCHRECSSSSAGLRERRG